MNSILRILAVAVATAFTSCSSNSDGTSLSSAFKSVPDTVKPENSQDYIEPRGLFDEGGMAEYLITKPYNKEGFIYVIDDLRYHVKVSKDYQDQMHKYPSLQIFNQNRTNGSNLFEAIHGCTPSRTDVMELCDCTHLKVE